MESEDDIYSFCSSSPSTDFGVDLEGNINRTDGDSDDSASLVCDLCNKSFDHPSTLRRHRKDHEASQCRGLSNEEYICHICNKLYYFTRLYHAHMRQRHGIEAEELGQGSEENKVDESPSKRRETEETRSPVTCCHCNRQFRSKGNLVNHMRMHFPLMYVCEVCQKSFASNAALRRHAKDRHKAASKKKQDLHIRSKPSKRIVTDFARFGYKSIVSSGSPKQPVPSNDQMLGEPIRPVQESAEVPVSQPIPSGVVSNTQLLAKEPIRPAQESAAKEPVSQPSSSTASAGISAQMSAVSVPVSPISNVSISAVNRAQGSSIETIDLVEEETLSPNFNCCRCPRKFFAVDKLQKHLLDIHRIPQMHFCTLCSFCSEVQFAFALHVLDHYKKKHKCDDCGRSFYTSSTLQHHIESIHTQP